MIKFTIDASGDHIQIDSVCGYGDQCLEKTKPIENKLGVVDETTRQLTEEFHAALEQTNYITS